MNQGSFLLRSVMAAVKPALVVFMSMTLLPCQTPGPADPDKARSEIAALEDTWLRAIESSDTRVLDSMLADDFLRPAPAAGRFVTKSEMLDYYRSRKPVGAGARHIEDLRVSVYQNMAIARGKVVTVDAGGHTLGTNLFTDVFLFRGGRWQAVSAQENDLAR